MKPVPKYKIIENFIKRITAKKGTQETYRSYLNRYFKILNIKNPDEYFTTKHYYELDVEKVVNSIKHIPEKTQQAMLSCIKRFFEKNPIEIKDKEGIVTEEKPRIRPSKWQEWIAMNSLKKAQTTTDDRIPSNNDIKNLLNFSNDIKTKALIMFLATTGCRIGETVQIKISNVDWDKRQVKIPAGISKTHRKRYSFFTEETKQVLNQWLTVRNKYIKTKKKKSTFVKDDKDDGRLFPFSKDNAKKIWNRLIERAGSPYNERDDNEKFNKPRYRYHLHTLRKHWFSAFQNTQANWNHINFLGGHESLLTASYTNLEENPDLLKKTYDGFSNCLSIFTALPELTELKEKQEDLVKENAKMKQEIHELRTLISEIGRDTHREVKKYLEGKHLFDELKEK